MSTPETEPTPSRSTVSRSLGVTRTLMAADRTLMAWLRTSLSMLSFGFTIYKFLEDIESKKGITLTLAQRYTDVPQKVGLFLSALGTIAILMGMIEYLHTLLSLHVRRNIVLRRPAMIMSIVMLNTGVLLFISIAFQLL